MSGLPSLDFLNRTPSLVGDSSSTMTLLSLLSQNLIITKIASIGKTGDARSSDQLVTNNEVMSVWVPTFIRNPPTIANGLNIGGNVDITGDLTIRGKLVVDNVGVTTPGAGNLTITDFFDGTGTAASNIAQDNTTVSGNITVTDSVGLNWQTGVFPAGQATLNARLVTQGPSPTVFLGPGGTISLNAQATDVSGTIRFETNGGLGIFVGDQLTLVYAESYATPPIVILWPANNNAATSYGMSGNDSFWIESFTTGFVLTYTEQSAASDEVVDYNYFVIDTSNTVPP